MIYLIYISIGLRTDNKFELLALDRKLKGWDRKQRNHTSLFSLTTPFKYSSWFIVLLGQIYLTAHPDVAQYFLEWKKLKQPKREALIILFPSATWPLSLQSPPLQATVGEMGQSRQLPLAEFLSFSLFLSQLCKTCGEYALS